MSAMVLIITAALVFGALALIVLIWNLESGQYEDLDGAAERILMDDPADASSTNHNKASS